MNKEMYKALIREEKKKLFQEEAQRDKKLEAPWESKEISASEEWTAPSHGRMVRGRMPRKPIKDRGCLVRERGV